MIIYGIFAECIKSVLSLFLKLFVVPDKNQTDWNKNYMEAL